METGTQAQSGYWPQARLFFWVIAYSVNGDGHAEEVVHQPTLLLARDEGEARTQAARMWPEGETLIGVVPFAVQ